MVLLEMSSRLGIVTRSGLGEAMRASFDSTAAKVVVGVLIVGAIGFGNAAYEAGNITGAALGLESILGLSVPVWAVIVGILAFALLATGTYRTIQRVLIGLVAVMSAVFLLTAIIVRPSISQMLSGLASPGIPEGGLLATTALIGTTVVPYALFLMASGMEQKWPESVPKRQAVAAARVDVFASMTLTGLLTVAIVATAAAAFFARGVQIEDAAQMADQLEPLLGSATRYMFAAGLFAAGITSAVTAPLAAAYAISGVVGWRRDLSDLRFKAIWALIIVIGTLFASLGGSPVEAILFAQAANGTLLPIIAIFLLYVMNKGNLLGEFRNGVLGNVVGGIVVLVASAIGLRGLLAAAGLVG